MKITLAIKSRGKKASTLPPKSARKERKLYLKNEHPASEKRAKREKIVSKKRKAFEECSFLRTGSTAVSYSWLPRQLHDLKRDLMT
jgi:hypothetical protein